MPADEREWWREAPTEELEPTEVMDRLQLEPARRFSWIRLALWLGVIVCLMIGGLATEILAWVWAVILFVALLLALNIVSRYWLHPRSRW